ncbi:hypothetical protein [Muricoccus radiodurans]|uniref:hypothetical protein n=1 Tax=Muricoccus radiodurans TaxID=2231721 RepID=UPI003CF7F8BF
MREIRAVNPRARLVQTADLGRTLSTPALAYQAEHENQRRWVSFDLLTGRVTREHPLWPSLAGATSEQELEGDREGGPTQVRLLPIDERHLCGA